MKKLLFLFVLILQNTVSAQTYYDVDNNKIDKPTFDKFLLDKQQYYYVENDSLKAFKLMYRYNRGEKGSLSDSANLFKTLNEKLNLNLDPDKPLIIYYYPGKDPCNSSGTATRKSKIQWNKELQKKVKKVADVNVLRIYKNKEGIETISDYDWKKDPNALIENLFFNYHYGCGSFAIINKDKYAAFFGEYGHNQVVESLKEILSKK